MTLRVVITPAPVRLQVLDRLRQAIIECRFEPGGRLIERDLCERMGVSRSSIREALRQLEAEGLITMIPNTGPMVSALTLSEARQIYEVRAALEGRAGRWFAERATDAEIGRLITRVVRIAQAVNKRDWSAFHKAKVGFYDTLSKGCRNDVLAQQLRLLRARVSLVRGRALSAEFGVAESVAEMEAIVAAVEAREPDRAESACIRHIDRSAERALVVLGEMDVAEPTKARRSAPKTHGGAMARAAAARKKKPPRARGGYDDR